MEEENVMTYPYLAKFKDEKEENVYVVWFLEKDYGVVVTSQREDVKFGSLGDFDEARFEKLGPADSIRLSNYSIEPVDGYDIVHVSR